MARSNNVLFRLSCLLLSLYACQADYVTFPSVQLCKQDYKPTESYYLYDNDNVQIGQQIFLPQYSVGMPSFGPQVISNTTLIAKLHNNEIFNSTRKITFKNNLSTKNYIEYYNAVSDLGAELAEHVTLPDLRIQTVIKEIPLPPPDHMPLPSFYVHIVDDTKLYEWFGVDDTRQPGALPGLWSFVSPFVPNTSDENHVALELTARNFLLNFHLFELSVDDIQLNPLAGQHSTRGLVTSVHYGHRCVLSLNTTVLLPDLREVSADFSEISRVVQKGVTSLLERNELLQQSFEERFPYTRFSVKVTCSPFMPIITGEDIVDERVDNEKIEEFEGDEEYIVQHSEVTVDNNHVEKDAAADLVLRNVNATELVHQLNKWTSQRVKVELLTELFETAVPLSINVKKLVHNTTNYATLPHELVFESECMHVINQTPVSFFLLASVTQLAAFALLLALVFFSLTVLLTLGNIVHLLKHFYGIRTPFIRVHESVMHWRLPYVTHRMYEENEGNSASSGGN